MRKFLKIFFFLSVFQNNVNATEMDLSYSWPQGQRVTHKSCDSFALELIALLKAGKNSETNYCGYYHDIKRLLETGGNVNQYDVHQDTTPLIAAAGCKDRNIVQMLIDHGADVNFQHQLSCCPQASHSPLTAALAEPDGAAYRMAQLLIKSGADVCRPNKFGSTPLMLLGKCEWKEVCGLIGTIVLKIVLGLEKWQHKRFITFLCCMKAHGFGRNIRSLFRSPLIHMKAQESRVRAIQEINKIENAEVKTRIFDTCRTYLFDGNEEELKFQKLLAQNQNIRRCWTPGCSFAYEVDELEKPLRFEMLLSLVFGEPIINCPNCGNSIAVNRNKTAVNDSSSPGCTIQ